MENTEEFDTIVGEDVELSGSIKNSGSILINGTVKGDVISQQSIVIGANAKVVGPVSAQTVQVSGTVEGSIEATDILELLPESKVSGDIKVNTLHIQPGATFVGTSSMPETENATTDKADRTTEKEETKEEKEKKHKPKLELESE